MNVLKKPLCFSVVVRRNIKLHFLFVPILWCFQVIKITEKQGRKLKEMEGSYHLILWQVVTELNVSKHTVFHFKTVSPKYAATG